MPADQITHVIEIALSISNSRAEDIRYEFVDRLTAG